MRIEFQCAKCPWRRALSIVDLDCYDPAEAPDRCPQCGAPVRGVVVGQGTGRNR